MISIWNCFFHILGISSYQLTFIFFQRVGETTNQLQALMIADEKHLKPLFQCGFQVYARNFQGPTGNRSQGIQGGLVRNHVWCFFPASKLHNPSYCCTNPFFFLIGIITQLLIGIKTPIGKQLPTFQTKLVGAWFIKRSRHFCAAMNHAMCISLSKLFVSMYMTIII